MRVLVTGGAGYLGTHTSLVLCAAGHHVSIVDNFSNASREAVRRTGELAGVDIPLHEADLLDRSAVDAVITQTQPDAVVHFAGLKAVGESNEQPLRYMSNNVTGTLNLLEAMQSAGVLRIIFSSSATVYGATDNTPTDESHPLAATNPYGRTKLFIEEILRDLAAADPRWSIGVLRYFNPTGAHQSGSIGEDPRGVPNNLVPLVGQVAVGVLPEVTVFGADYPTPDGTGIRDYVHVMDLAQGHVAALEWTESHRGVGTWNLGTGSGSSVLEIINLYSEIANREVPYRVVERRHGDVAVSFADASKAARELSWTATRNLHDMIEDHWRWQSTNPHGYHTKGVL